MAKLAKNVVLCPSRDIPVNKPVLSQSNVRRIKAGVSVEELAEDIARRGLLQGLNVRPMLDADGVETGTFEIPAGGRRFQALSLLVKQKRLAKTAPIPCIVREAASEILAEDGETLRELGGEFGATTGRPRRCGWFDQVAARYSVEINGMTGVVITKLDILDSLPEIKVATAYDIDGEQTPHFQVRADVLPRCRPVYKTFSGWEKPTVDCRTLTDLPAKARHYLEFIERELGVLVIGISVGQHPDQDIWTPTGVSS